MAKSKNIKTSNKASNSIKDSSGGPGSATGKNRSGNPGGSASGGSTKNSVAQFPDNRPARSGPGGN